MFHHFAGEELTDDLNGFYQPIQAGRRFWPEAPARLDRLVESIEIIRKLFSGKVVKHAGTHFTLESARLYTMPDSPPPIYVATSGPVMSERTGRLADGIITVGAPDEKI